MDTAEPFKSPLIPAKMLVSQKHHLSTTKNVFRQNNVHHLFSEEKGLTKKPMVGGKLSFSRLNGLLEKHAFCRLAHF